MKEQAFTYLELLFTLALFIILFQLLSPSWQHWLTRVELKKLVNQLQTGLQYARGEAMQRQVKVAYCGSSDGERCDGQWGQHQLVVDLASHNIFRVFSPLSQRFQITWNSSLGKNTQLVFLPTGFTYGQQGNFAVTLRKTGKLSASLIVLRSGRIRYAENAE